MKGLSPSSSEWGLRFSILGPAALELLSESLHLYGLNLPPGLGIWAIPSRVPRRMSDVQSYIRGGRDDRPL